MLCTNKSVSFISFKFLTHSQLIALPIVPTSVLDEIDGCRAHYQDKERCIY